MRRGLLASCLLLVATAAGIAAARPVSVQASGGVGLWSRAAGLVTGREEHTATLLRNGDVLVTGGRDGSNNVLASAELYHPATNRWTPSASMAASRYDHTATLLPNGNVLVLGGLAGPLPFGSLASSELYDPTANSWSAAAPMILSRARHTATLLADGRVLVVGGLSLVVREGGLVPSQVTDAEIYDPAANRWSTTGPMGFSRLDHTAVRLADGRVLVAGGEGEGPVLNSTEIYDPTTNRWISAAPMAVGRRGHTATLLPDGDVLVVGGIGSTPDLETLSLRSGEIYDPRTNLWVTVASTAEVHVEHTATLLDNEVVLVLGLSGGSRPEVYDLAHNTWSIAGPLMDRDHHTATRLGNGKVLIVGGGIESLDTVLLYDPNGVTPVPRQPFDLRGVAEALLIGLLLIGGATLFVPAVRLRLRSWRPHPEPDEWIS
jgi:N-acetylneuraminic acid mutarotase